MKQKSRVACVCVCVFVCVCVCQNAHVVKEFIGISSGVIKWCCLMKYTQPFKDARRNVSFIQIISSLASNHLNSLLHF